MSPETTALLLAVGAWLRSVAVADAFPLIAGFVAAAWTLRGQKDYAPGSLGKVLLTGVLSYFIAFMLRAWAQRG